jgi:hypothetical protein
MNDAGYLIEPRGVVPMERFVSQQNIERYRKLLDISTDDFQRRLIFNPKNKRNCETSLAESAM